MPKGLNFARMKREVIAELLTMEDFQDQRDAKQAALDWQAYDLGYLRKTLEYNREHHTKEESKDA